MILAQLSELQVVSLLMVMDVVMLVVVVAQVVAVGSGGPLLLVAVPVLLQLRLVHEPSHMKGRRVILVLVVVTVVVVIGATWAMHASHWQQTQREPSDVRVFTLTCQARLDWPTIHDVHRLAIGYQGV